MSYPVCKSYSAKNKVKLSNRNRVLDRLWITAVGSVNLEERLTMQNREKWAPILEKDANELIRHHARYVLHKICASRWSGNFRGAEKEIGFNVYSNLSPFLDLAFDGFFKIDQFGGIGLSLEPYQTMLSHWKCPGRMDLISVRSPGEMIIVEF